MGHIATCQGINRTVFLGRLAARLDSSVWAAFATLQLVVEVSRSVFLGTLASCSMEFQCLAAFYADACAHRGQQLLLFCITLMATTDHRLFGSVMPTSFLALAYSVIK